MKNDDVVIDMIANTHSDGMLKGSPLREGDILRTVNNRKAREFLGCVDDGCSSYIRGGSFHDGQAVTFITERPSENELSEPYGLDQDPKSDSAIVRAFCRKSTSRNNDERLKAIGVTFHRVVVEEEEESDRKSTKDACIETESESDTESTSDDVSTSSRSPSSSSFLQIDKIDPNGLLAHSVLNQGDVILAINGYSVCADENITIEEANEMMGLGPATEATSPSLPMNVSDSDYSVYETVDILALNPRKLQELQRNKKKKVLRKWMKKQAKRAGVALGGGTMIGVGLVVPFATCLMAGGVTVLGTEFETPNRMVRNARDSLEKWAEEEIVFESTEEDTSGQEGLASVAAPTVGRSQSDELIGESITTRKDTLANVEDTRFNDDNTTETAQLTQTLLPLPTVKTRMKGLGRRYVLPFLDRMAGDRRNISINPSSSFDIDENGNRVSSAETMQELQLQRQQHQLQGRDDDCGQVNGNHPSYLYESRRCSL
jgi:hypothetical protein